MSRYVSGERIPKAPLAIRIADALGVDVKELYEWESEKRTGKRTETHACDCISRQRAIDAVKRNTFRLTFAEEQNYEGHVAWSAEAVYSDVMEGALLELPPAQPEQRWIPCSERLPEDYADKRPDIPHSWKPSTNKTESENKECK